MRKNRRGSIQQPENFAAVRFNDLAPGTGWLIGTIKDFL